MFGNKQKAWTNGNSEWVKSSHISILPVRLMYTFVCVCVCVCVSFPTCVWVCVCVSMCVRVCVHTHMWRPTLYCAGGQNTRDGFDLDSVCLVQSQSCHRLPAAGATHSWHSAGTLLHVITLYTLHFARTVLAKWLHAYEVEAAQCSQTMVFHSCRMGVNNCSIYFWPCCGKIVHIKIKYIFFKWIRRPTACVHGTTTDKADD